MEPVTMITTSSSEPDRSLSESSRDSVTGSRGGSESSSTINRHSRLKTVLRLDPAVGIGVYTESARVQRVLESSGLANRIAGNERGAYFLIPADNHELATAVIAATFSPRGA